MTGNYYGGRYQRNVASRDWAHRDMLPWTEDEDEFIIEEWMAYDNFPGERDEETVSKILERTIEACRNRAEILRRNHGIETPNVVPIRTGKNRPYIGAHDEDGDRWWES